MNAFDVRDIVGRINSDHNRVRFHALAESLFEKLLTLTELGTFDFSDILRIIC